VIVNGNKNEYDKSMDDIKTQPDQVSTLDAIQIKPQQPPSFLTIIFVFVIGFLLGFIIRSLSVDTIQPPSQTAGEDTITTTEPSEQEFCKKYGTYQVSKNDLLKTYEVEKEMTLDELLGEALDNHYTTQELMTINPELNAYEATTAAIPRGTQVKLPDQSLDVEGVTSFIKAQGNISFNPDQPMFGVNAPNTGTGPFIISEEIEDKVKQLKQGDCVEVIYGSRGYSSIKVVFDIFKQ
jgi:hypothetical protein